MKSCVVIGSGIGGLSLAALLSQKDFKVTVLEAHQKIGGYTQSLGNEGYEFSWPRYLWNFGKGEIGWRFLKKCNLLEQLPMVELNSSGFNHIYIEDRPSLEIPKSWESYKDFLQSRYPQEKQALQKYFM